MSPQGLAQRGDLFVTIAPWLGVLVVLIIVGGVLAMWIKRRFLESGQDASASMGFTLSDLREMVKTGEISPEEFEAARHQLIERVRGNRDDLVVPDPEKPLHGDPPE